MALTGISSGQTFVTQGQDDIISGNYNTTTGTFDTATLVNQVDGATFLYNSGYFGSGEIIANVEGGLIWDSHDVFDRSQLAPGLASSPAVTLTSFITPDPTTAPDAGQYDFHATMVGNVLAGTGYVTNSDGSSGLSYLGVGMAPYASLWSGAIATSYDSTNLGSFNISQESFLTPTRRSLTAPSSTAS